MRSTHTQGEPGVARTRDGRALFYMRRRGPGSAIVVFESGLAASRSWWALVQESMAQAATSVAYDRTGLGRSAPAPKSRALPQLADDLVDVLDHLGTGPFVLVGHSWGGPVVRLAAAARRDRVAGVVLVDPADEGSTLAFARSTRIAERVGQVVSAGLARVELLAVAYRSTLAALPPDALADIRAEGFTMSVMRTRAAELATTQQDLRNLHQQPPDLSDVPTTVISGGRAAGMPKRVRAAMTAAHQATAARANQGRHVVAHRSGHLIPVTEPELVAAEITRLLPG